MTQHENTCFVDVPVGEKPYLVQGRLHFGEEGYAHKDKLPPGSWRFIALHSQMTEEKAREVVEPPLQSSTTYYSEPEDMTNVERIEHKKAVNGCKFTWKKIERTYYKDYSAKQPRRAFTWVGEVDTALESYHSLYRRLGLVGEQAVLKKM